MSDAPSRPHTDALLVTPEAVVLDLPLAGIGSRAIAFAIDALIMAVGLVALTLAGSLLDDAFSLLPSWVGVTVILLSITTLLFGYPIAFETAWRGRTPGKAALGLRVVTTEGGPVGLRHAASRAILGIVDFHITGGAAALFSAFLSRRSQRLGDLVAGTVVVRERSGAVAPTAATFTVPQGLETVARTLDVSGIDAVQYQAVRTMLRRAPTLAAPTRDSLAADLVRRLHPTATAGIPQGVPPIVALQLIAAAVQSRGNPTPTHPGPTTPSTPTTRGGGGDLARPLDVWSPRAGERSGAGSGGAAVAGPPGADDAPTPTGFHPPS